MQGTFESSATRGSSVPLASVGSCGPNTTLPAVTGANRGVVVEELSSFSSSEKVRTLARRPLPPRCTQGGVRR